MKYQRQRTIAGYAIVSMLLCLIPIDSARAVILAPLQQQQQPLLQAPAPQQQQQIAFVPPPPQCSIADFDANGIAEFTKSLACLNSSPTSPTLNPPAPWDQTNPIWSVLANDSQGDWPGVASCLNDFANAWARVSNYKTGVMQQQTSQTPVQSAPPSGLPFGAADQSTLKSIIKNLQYLPSKCQKPAQNPTSANDYRKVPFSGNATSRYQAINLSPPPPPPPGGFGAAICAFPPCGINSHLQLQCHVDLTNYSGVSQYAHVEGRYAISEAFLPIQSDYVIDTAVNESTTCTCNIDNFVIDQRSASSQAGAAIPFTEATFSDMVSRFGKQLSSPKNTAAQTEQQTRISNLSQATNWDDGPSSPLPCGVANLPTFWPQQITTLQTAEASAIASYNTAMVKTVNQTRVAVQPDPTSGVRIVSLFAPSQISGAAAPNYTQNAQNTAPTPFQDALGRTWYLVEPYQTLHLKYNNDLLLYQIIGGGDIRATQVCSGEVEVCDDNSSSEVGFLIGSGDIEYVGGSPVNYDATVNENPIQNYLSAPVSIGGGKAF